MLAFYMSLVDDENEKKVIEELYNSNKQTMYSIALSCLHNPQDAEDIVHEAFLVAIKKSKKIFSIPSNKRIPFLDVIVRNMCYSVLRRKKLTDSENSICSFFLIYNTLVLYAILIPNYTKSYYKCYYWAYLDKLSHFKYAKV